MMSKYVLLDANLLIGAFDHDISNAKHIESKQIVESLLLDNDINKSEKIKSNFNKISSSYPYPGEIESELELIDIAYNKYLEK